MSLTHFKSEVTVDVTIQRNSNTEHYRCPQLCLCLQTEVPSFISHSLICGFLLTGLGRNCPGVTGGAGETRPAKIVQEGKLGTWNWQAERWDEALRMSWGNGIRTNGTPFRWHHVDIYQGSSSFWKDMFINLEKKEVRKSERKRGRETSMWKRNISLLLPIHAPAGIEPTTWNRTHNLGMCPDQDSNP